MSLRFSATWHNCRVHREFAIGSPYEFAIFWASAGSFPFHSRLPGTLTKFIASLLLAPHMNLLFSQPGMRSLQFRLSGIPPDPLRVCHLLSIWVCYVLARARALPISGHLAPPAGSIANLLLALYMGLPFSGPGCGPHRFQPRATPFTPPDPMRMCRLLSI